MAYTRYGELRNALLRRAYPTVFAPVVMRDADSNYVPIPISERLVQCIWYDQRVQRESLVTTDGRRVRVIFQGWWNLEAGPDFLHATVQIGDEPERTGAVEIHLRADDWFHHGHQHDPQYDDVVLHVVLWSAGSDRRPATRAGSAVPQLVLQDQLAAPLEALYDDIDLDAYPHDVGSHHGRCAAVLTVLPAAKVGELFDEAGDERFYAKVRRFGRWIHRVGAAQAFYEGWMEALGYKANKAAFRALAQRLPVATLQDQPPLAQQAILFGVANFLPTRAAKPQDSHAKRLWGIWWKRRPEFGEQVLAAETWRLHGIRPANRPHRRLGAAAALLRRHPDLWPKVLGAVESGGDPARLFAQVRDDYWSRHFTLGGKPQRTASELIGAARMQEILANVLLPFVAAHAQLGADTALYEKAKARFNALPATASNAALRLAGRQLFDGAATQGRLLKTARRQQGLIQIFQDFCLNDKSACQMCRFPELIEQLARG